MDFEEAIHPDLAYSKFPKDINVYLLPILFFTLHGTVRVGWQASEPLGVSHLALGPCKLNHIELDLVFYYLITCTHFCHLLLLS